MNGHFSVANKRGLIVSGAILVICIILFSLCLAMRLSTGSVLWTIPLVACIIVFIIAIILLISVATAGVDVSDNAVYFADVTGKGGKIRQFELKELKEIQLHNQNGLVENPDPNNMIGARIVFVLKNGKTKTYYPIQLTYKQYKNIANGMFDFVEEAKKQQNQKKHGSAKAAKAAAKVAKSKKPKRL